MMFPRHPNQRLRAYAVATGNKAGANPHRQDGDTAAPAELSFRHIGLLLSILLLTWLNAGCLGNGNTPTPLITETKATPSPVLSNPLPTGKGNVEESRQDSTPTPSIAEIKAVPSPVLPNLLLDGKGKVEVSRQDSIQWIPIGFGAVLGPGDVLRVSESTASVFCGNESQWDQSPKELLPGDKLPVGCLAGRTLRPAPDLTTLKGLRGESPPAAVEELHVMSPRTGFVLNDRPRLRWHPVTGVDVYTVTLKSNDGLSRPPMEARGGELEYPSIWLPLQRNGADYTLVVTAPGRSSEDTVRLGEGFTLLDAKKATELARMKEHLGQRPLDEPDRTLMTATLYLHDDFRLRSEAINLLTILPKGESIPAVQQLLGETYLAMGLFNEAQAALERALALAQAQGLPEVEANAWFGLGIAACGLWDADVATERWGKAMERFRQLDLVEMEKSVTDWLSKAPEQCPPPPAAP